MSFNNNVDIFLTFEGLLFIHLINNIFLSSLLQGVNENYKVTRKIETHVKSDAIQHKSCHKHYLCGIRNILLLLTLSTVIGSVFNFLCIYTHSEGRRLRSEIILYNVLTQYSHFM